MRLQQIETKGEFRVARIEENDILQSTLRDVRQKPIDRFSMRIDIAYAAAILDILQTHILKYRRLAHTGLADHVHVAQPIRLGISNEPSFTAMNALADVYVGHIICA